MGNEQSTPGSRRSSNKLSKPRTNSNSNILTSASKSALTSASKAALSRRNSQVDDVVDQLDIGEDKVIEDGPEVPEDIAGKERPEPTKRGSKRMSLQIFRSKSSRSQSETTLEEDVAADAAADADVSISSARVSRSNSMVCESIAESSHSNSMLDRYDISGPREVNTMLTSSRPLFRRARMSLQHIPHSHKTRLSLVAEVNTPEPEAFASFESSRLDEDAGSSTRPSIEGNDTPNTRAIRRRSMLQHGIATRTDTTKRQSGSSYTDEVRDYYYNPAKSTSSPLAALEALDNTQRAETPTEFRHLGAFKLGSLRITNGAASPSSSVASICADDYVSASPGESHRFPPRSQTYSVPPQPKRTWTRAQSPLRQPALRNQPDLIINVPDPSLALFRFNDDTPRKSLGLPQHYQQDNALSPLSFDPSPRVSPGLEATSKHTAIEDDLFEIETASPVQSSEFQDPVRVSNEYGRRSVPPTQLAKADSGYSSNVSLRSLNQDRSPTHPTTEFLSSTSSWTNAPRDSTHLTMGKSRNSLPALASGRRYQVPVLDPTSMPQQTALHNPTSPMTCGVQTVIQTTLLPPEPVQHKRQKSLPSEAMTQQSPVDSSKAKKTVAPTTSRWRLLRKKSSQKLPQHKAVFTVKADIAPHEEYSVPRVSAEASRHLHAQVKEFPTNSVPSTIGESTAITSPPSEFPGTIAIQGPADKMREDLRRARRHTSLPATSLHDDNHLAWKPQPQNRISQESTRPTQGSRSYSQRAISGASRRYQSQRDFVTDITSYDAVSSSLGWSSYDVASYAADTESSSEKRAKAMTSQLEPSAAARFARARAEHLGFLQEIQPPPQVTSKQHPQPRRPATLVPAAAFSTPDLHAPIQSAPLLKETWRRTPPVSMHTNSRPPIRQSRSNPNTPPITSHSNASTPNLSGPEPPLPNGGPAKPMSAEAWAAKASYWRSQRELAAQDKDQVILARKSTDSAPARRAPLQRPSMSRLNHHVSFDTFGTYKRPVDEARQYYGEEHATSSTYYENDNRHPLQVQRKQGMLVMDRYSGGLGNGDFGIPGATGLGLATCVGAFNGADRKSIHASRRYGVDLCDVPVYELPA